MTDEAFARYFAEREQYERAMSDRARRVAQVHGEMAQRFTEWCGFVGEAPKYQHPSILDQFCAAERQPRVAQRFNGWCRLLGKTPQDRHP